MKLKYERTLDMLANPDTNTPQAFAELVLRGAELLEGGGEVLEFVVELLFYLG